jgi:hypothetical protein
VELVKKHLTAELEFEIKRMLFPPNRAGSVRLSLERSRVDLHLADFTAVEKLICGPTALEILQHKALLP